MQCIIVSGRSGSGKSISLSLLEDLGYYCVDNLPASMLPSLAQQVAHRYQKLAVGIDARTVAVDVDHLQEVIRQLREDHGECQVVYLDADESVLLKRFSETRRKHPLTNDSTSLKEAIAQEQRLLAPIAHLADLRIDTSRLGVHELRLALRERVARTGEKNHLSLLLLSFGFKYGVPRDSDFVFDVRCLPNPFWQPDLRMYSGLEQPIQAFLEQQPVVKQMSQSIRDFIDTWLPHFEADDRNYLTVAIGCTGGRHRSVYVAESLYRHYHQAQESVQVRHKELLR